MNNHRDILGLIVNIIVVAVILLTIVFGLNRIGIYDLPDFVEKLLGTYEENNGDVHTGNNDITDSIKYNDNGIVVVSDVDLTYESARELLSLVVPVTDYTHTMIAEYVGSDDKVFTENVSIVCENGLYEAAVFDKDSNVKKRIKESEDSVVIENVEDKSPKITLPRGNFDISDECGFILSCENFLSSDYELDEASFSVSNGTHGAQIKIVFDTIMGEYIQKETYVISLDLGVVVSAECRENDKLVYSMKTKSLIKN